jgi:hypothetical protein
VRLLAICRYRALERANSFLRHPNDVFFLSLSQFRNVPVNVEAVIESAKKKHNLLMKTVCADAYIVEREAFVPLYRSVIDVGSNCLKGLVASAPLPFVTVRLTKNELQSESKHSLKRVERVLFTIRSEMGICCRRERFLFVPQLTRPGPCCSGSVVGWYLKRFRFNFVI